MYFTHEQLYQENEVFREIWSDITPAPCVSKIKILTGVL